MTLPDNDTLAKLLTDATPGPWDWHEPDDLSNEAGDMVIEYVEYEGQYFPSDRAEYNCALVALAPALAAEVIALRKRVKAADDLEAACDRFTDEDFHDANQTDVQSIYRARSAYRATVTS